MPAPEAVSAEVETNFVAPRTPVEEVLAGIWSDVLRTPRIGANDSFFELGGHSLLATQIASVSGTLVSRFCACHLRKHPGDAAVRYNLNMFSAARSGVAPVVRTSREAELPLSFAQQRLWFIDRLTPESPLYNMPMAVRLDAAQPRCAGADVAGLCAVTKFWQIFSGPSKESQCRSSGPRLTWTRSVCHWLTSVRCRKTCARRKCDAWHGGRTPV